ncbi:hypothetical protein [Streptomyces sp. B15]|uniref:hypothetical protein n=1 Tax=Streptomyces sp. B15 TaxID=1537797 RepID=UPI001B3625A3|nr:hypothetical protein [Streptomyces sp. B15]MBQ1122179.1 hypothetical protein [Streptomyces sp. B15]
MEIKRKHTMYHPTIVDTDPEVVERITGMMENRIDSVRDHFAQGRKQPAGELGPRPAAARRRPSCCCGTVRRR